MGSGAIVAARPGWLGWILYGQTATRVLTHFLQTPLQFAKQFRAGFDFLSEEREHIQCLLGDVMLHAFDVLVDRFFINAKSPQEPCEHFVTLDDVARYFPAFVREADAPILLINNKSFCIQSLHHCRNRGLRNAQIRGNFNGPRIPLGFNQEMNLFKVILNGRGGNGRSGRHDLTVEEFPPTLKWKIFRLDY
jgi:hypothetical protein